MAWLFAAHRPAAFKADQEADTECNGKAGKEVDEVLRAISSIEGERFPADYVAWSKFFHGNWRT
jgi:hypothetical protein